MEKRIKPAIEAARELAVARGNSAIVAIGYFSEGRSNLQLVGLNVSLDGIWEYWARRFLKTIHSSGQPINGCRVQVEAFGRHGLAHELRELICSKIPPLPPLESRKKKNPGNSAENGRRRFRHLDRD